MPDLIHHKDGEKCPAGLHDYVPILEDDRLIGIVCVICGKATYENRAASGFIVTSSGLQSKGPEKIHKRKGPRF